MSTPERPCSFSCATGFRDPGGNGRVALTRLADASGCTGLFLTAPWSLGDLPDLIRDALRTGLHVVGGLGPLPDRALAAGRRLPQLAAFDDEQERLAAIDLVGKLARILRDAGGEVLALDLGEVPLGIRRRDLERRFARRELLGNDDPPDDLFGRLGAERRAKAARCLDAARFSLERLAREVASNLPVMLRPAKTPWELPSPREAADLVHEFDGAGFGLAFDTGRWAVLKTLGLSTDEERRAALVRQARLVFATDAAGLASDLAPGLGEVDFPSSLREVTRSGLAVVLSGRSDSTEDELAHARALIEAALPGSEPPHPAFVSSDEFAATRARSSAS